MVYDILLYGKLANVNTIYLGGSLIIMKRKHSRLSGLPVLLLTLVMIIGMSSFTFAASKPGTPVIKSLKSNDAGSIVVKVGTIKGAKGYQVKYSLNKNFSGAKTKTIKGRKLYNKTVSGFKSGKKYYVRVRAYTTNKKGKRVYSAYSKKRSVVIAQYVTGYSTDFILHCKTKKNANAANVNIPYMSKVLVSKSIAPRTTAQWVKLKYNGKVCYKYFHPNVTYFTDAPIEKTDYANFTDSEIRKQVVDFALSILDEKTTYKNTAKIEPGTRDSNGRMQFDCSGFTSYVLNAVMQAYIPSYDLSNGIEAQEDGGLLYTDKNGDFTAASVCKGKPDFSKLQPGDLVFFDDNDKVKGDCDHVGIYIGNKEFIHSVSTIDGVCVMPMGSGRYYERFLFARRFVPDSAPEPMNETMYVESPWTTGVKVYQDTRFNNPMDDTRLYDDDPVIVDYITPCNWSKNGESCCLIIFDDGKTGYIQMSRLKKNAEQN